MRALRSVGAFLVSIVLVVSALTSVVQASHDEPAKANKATFGLVNSYFPCYAPNTATAGSALPACAPAVPNDFCHLTSTGSGKLTISRIGSASEANQDLKISAVVNGLNEVCEAMDLSVFLSYRLTTDDCPEGSCTGVDVIEYDFPLAYCVVTGGKCKINTTLNTVTSGLITTMGKNAGITILGCGLRRGFGVLGGTAVECGVLLK